MGLIGHMTIPGLIILIKRSGALIGQPGIICPLLDVGGVNSKSHKLDRITMEQGVCVCVLCV